MKIAKKVLALVMAIALVGVMSAVAFAADPQIVVKAALDDGVVTVTVYAVNAVGMLAVNGKLDVDSSVLEYDYSEEGADAAQMGDTKNNSFSYEFNDATGEFGAYFKEALPTAAEAAAAAKKGKTVAINDANFALVTLYYNVKEGATADSTAIKFDVTSKNGVASLTGVGTTVTLKTTPSTPANPTTPGATGVPATTAEAGTKKAVPSNSKTGDQKTGDNAALIAAIGVVALAGAAFVISKKRT